MITVTITTTVRCDETVDGFICRSRVEIECGKKYAKRALAMDGWTFKSSGKAKCPVCNGKELIED